MISTENVDYIQRIGARPPSDPTSVSSPPSEMRRSLRISGIGREKKDVAAPAVPEQWSLRSSDLVAGLYGYRIPIAFHVRGGPSGIRIDFGTWSAKTGSSAIDRRIRVADGVLRSLYPNVDASAHAIDLEPLSLSGLALGVPTAKPPTADDNTVGWDRVARGMAGGIWTAIILAQPLREDFVTDLRHSVVNEMRSAEQTAKMEQGPSPLMELYVELLKAQLKMLSQGAAIGAWRTACYLLGDRESYPQLASIWRSTFSGERSVPEPIRVFDHPDVAGWAMRWALPEDEGAAGPGLYRHPFEFQTVLTSQQLAAYIHLPQQELPGFRVDALPRFDAVVPVGSNGARTVLGRIVHGARPTQMSYAIDSASLTRHVLVCGVTGAGKSTTIFQLLEQLDEVDVPFLVVEPAKAEYRALLHHPRLGPKLQIFTLGDERISPFRLNPFEVPDGVTVSEHIDVLRATMAGSFGMWTPLPQVLERCLYEIYADRGWELATNTNARARDGDSPRAFPTLADLAAKVESVTAALGYEDRIKGDIHAALTTRIHSLRAGGKGRMLDVLRSVPLSSLLTRPTILELDPMGDDDDKAFLMGLLVVRLVQHRRAQGPSASLRHVMVIEEAHRLLSAQGPRTSQEDADPKGKTVEMFSNLLSEVRAYGQGMIIADQVPVRLAPDVLKNTGLKVAHRTVANDDREALAGTMSMSKEQSEALTSLAPGRAAVFGAGDDAPVLIQVSDMKNDLIEHLPTGTDVAAHMRSWRDTMELRDMFLPSETCATTCVDAEEECRLARALLDEPAVQATISRMLLSTAANGSAIERLMPDLMQVVRAREPANVDEGKLLIALAGHAAEWFTDRLGARRGLSYTDSGNAALSTGSMLSAALRGSQAASQSERIRYQRVLTKLSSRTFDPFPVCMEACGASECLYREAVADVVGSGRFDDAWRTAEGADMDAGSGTRAETWAVCEDAAYEVVEWVDGEMPQDMSARVEAAGRKASLCFAQQMLERDQHRLPRTRRWILQQLLSEAEASSGHEAEARVEQPEPTDE